jgi:hypothetical protein
MNVIEIRLDIRPILSEIYGHSATVDAMVEDLAERIHAFEPRDEDFFGPADKQREDMIRLQCWNWFSGGGTAAIAAERIEAALCD